MKRQKTVLQDGENMYRAMFGEDSICPEQELTIEEINESIAECHAMLLYAIDLGNKEEIASWRRMLQRAKCDKRRMLNAS